MLNIQDLIIKYEKKMQTLVEKATAVKSVKETVDEYDYIARMDKINEDIKTLEASYYPLDSVEAAENGARDQMTVKEMKELRDEFELTIKKSKDTQNVGGQSIPGTTTYVTNIEKILSAYNKKGAEYDMYNTKNDELAQEIEGLVSHVNDIILIRDKHDRFLVMEPQGESELIEPTPLDKVTNLEYHEDTESITWTPVVNANRYIITISNNDATPTVETLISKDDFEEITLQVGTSTISIVAESDDSKYTQSEATTIEVVIEAEIEEEPEEEL